MRSLRFIVAILSASLFSCSAFAFTDAELKDQYAKNIASLSQWAVTYDQRRHEVCTLTVQKIIENVKACSRAYEVLMSRFKTEAQYNQLRTGALSLDSHVRGEILDSVLTNSVIDDFNKETRRIEGWVNYLYPAANK